ncbi:FhuF/siderophore biosynthesis protein, C-terminal [Actinobacteria bacterium OK074]|nr:FhuF/siderophore biosynthesis protein, C-terminal [Actinobacteria bacterium OK074]
MTRSGTASAVIEEITALGPFFAVESHPSGTEPSGPWQPVSRPLLEARVTGVGEWLAAAGGQPSGAVETRVAASVAHLGLAARLVSPALAAAVLHGLVLAPGLTELRWQPVLGGPVPLSLPDDAFAAGPAASPARLADELSGRLLNGALRELADAFAEFAVSRHILWGNTASAVNGAATMLVAARPDLTAPIRTLTALLLDRPPLRDAGTMTPNGAFRRRSCCLIYRAAPDGKGALCGDCALHHREARAVASSTTTGADTPGEEGTSACP